MAGHKWEPLVLVGSTRALTEANARHWKGQRCARCGVERKTLRGLRTPKWFYKPDDLHVWKHLERVPNCGTTRAYRKALGLAVPLLALALGLAGCQVSYTPAAMHTLAGDAEDVVWFVENGPHGTWVVRCIAAHDATNAPICRRAEVR